MNIDKQTFNTLDVLYDDKKWGKRIDPDEWNANFKVLEEGHNELAQKLNKQVADIDVAVQAATSDGGQNINVQYGAGTETLQGALDNIVSDINNRYSKNEVDATIGSNTNSLLANAEYNESTGVFTFTRKDGSKVIFDTVIEKVPASMALVNESDGSVSLVITNQDGSTTKTNVTSLIEDTVINSSDTINATSVTDAVKKVTTYTLVIKPNSIGLSHVDTELTTKFDETQTAKNLAVQAKDNAVTAQNVAVAAQKSAENYASNSSSSATASAISADESADSALEAKGYAEQAASSKDSATLSASVASTKATAAATSEANAKTSETNAGTSETNALNSANDAKTYAEQANTYATNAGNSANQASNYATNASGSADSASSKAEEASASAASALTYKTAAELANTQAQAAKTAAEKARDEAQSIAGGDYATRAELNEHANNTTLHFTADEKTKLAGIELNANNYIHPSSHPASMITQDSTHRFVTDSEKTKWNTNEVFIATYGTTTNSEIESAYQSGKAVFCKKGSYLFVFVSRLDENTHVFSSVDTASSSIAVCSSNTWSVDYTDLPPKIGDTDIGNVLSVDKYGSPIWKDIKPTITTVSLLALNWDLSAKNYSFETEYPTATYDIEIALDSTATTAQAEAFNGAQIVGSATSNIIKAYGEVPTIDIPIILKVVKK